MRTMQSPRKIFLIIFTLSLTLLLIPSSLFYANYAVNQKEREIARYLETQKKNAEALCSFIDQQFLHLINTSYAIAVDDRIIETIKAFDDTRREIGDLFARRKAITRTASYIGTSAILEDILILSKKKDVILSTTGWFSKEEFEDIFYSNHVVDWNIEAQKTLLPLNMIHICGKTPCSDSYCTGNLLFYCPIYDTPQTAEFDVLFVVNKKKLTQYIRTLTTDTYLGERIQLNDSVLYQSGLPDTDVHYQENIFSYYTNLSCDFAYQAPHIPFWSDNNFISFLVVFLFSLLLSTLLSFGISKPIYRIWARLSEAKGHHLKLPQKTFTNPITLFEEYVDHVVTSQEQLSVKVDQYRNMMDQHNLFLSVLLTDDADAYLDEIIEVCPWFSEEGFYAVLLINSVENIAEKTSFQSAISILEEHQRKELLHYHFINLLNCDLAVLLAYSNADASALQALLAQLRTVETKLLLAAGSLQQGIPGIQASYHTARKTLQQHLYNTGEVIEGYFFPVHLEFQLINALKSANIEASKDILAVIFEQNHELHLSPIQLKKLYCMIYESFGRLAKETGCSIEENRRDFERVVNGDFAGILEIFFALCDLLSTYTIKKTEESDQKLGGEIYEYIKQNFTDPAICTDSIAAHFHVSRSILYKIMRGISEVSLTDLINRLRINQAIVLIEESNDTITNISKQVGYESYSTFKRIFIKNTGVPPSDYKRGCGRDSLV